MLDLDRTERLNLGLAAATIAGSVALRSTVFTASVAVGAAIEVVNYRVLRRFTEKFFAGELGGAGPWTAGYGLRFVFVGIAMAIALGAGAHPVGLVLGLSTIVPAVVIHAWRSRPADGPVPAAPPPDDPSWDRWNPWLARERDPEEDDDA